MPSLNWPRIFEGIEALAKQRDWDNDPAPTVAYIAQILGLNYETFRQALVRHGVSAATFTNQMILGTFENPYSKLTRDVKPGEPFHTELVSEPWNAGQIETLGLRSDGENQVASVESEFPKSAEEIAELVGIDLEKYSVVKFETFARQVYVKDVTKDLSFDDGKITGSIVDNGTMTVKTIWSTRVSFSPKVIKAPEVILKAVRIDSLPEFAGLNPERSDTAKDSALVIPDIHFGYNGNQPFHDQRAIETMFDIIGDREFSHIFVLGDLLDMTEWSTRFVPPPGAIGETQRAFTDAAIFLARLRRYWPEAQISYLEGNHEARYRLYVEAKLPQLMRLSVVGEPKRETSSIIPTYLGLDKIGVDWYEGYPGNFVEWKGVRVFHGNKAITKHGGTVAAISDQMKFSTVFGHIHRMETIYSSYERAWGSRNLFFSMSPGCLCRIDGILPGATGQENWRQGFATLEFRVGRPVYPEVYPV